MLTLNITADLHFLTESQKISSNRRQPSRDSDFSQSLATRLADAINFHGTCSALPSKSDGCTGQIKQNSHARIIRQLRRSSDNKLRCINFHPPFELLSETNRLEQRSRKTSLASLVKVACPFEGDQTTAVNQDVGVDFPLSACVTHLSHRAEAEQTKTRVSSSCARYCACHKERKPRTCNIHMCINLVHTSKQRV
jgi:hypothetical protein